MPTRTKWIVAFAAFGALLILAGTIATLTGADTSPPQGDGTYRDEAFMIAYPVGVVLVLGSLLLWAASRRRK